MILTLDIGNAEIVLCCVEDGRRLCRFSLSTDRARTADEYAALMRRLGKGRLVTADTDASGARALFYDRVKLLTDIDD